MSAAQLDSGHSASCDYRYAAATGGLTLLTERLPSGAVTSSCGTEGGSSLLPRTGVEEFGRGSSVDSDVVTQVRERTPKKNGPGPDGAQTEEEVYQNFPCPARQQQHEPAFKHNLTDTAGINVFPSLKENGETNITNQFQEEQQTFIDQNNHHNNKEISADKGLDFLIERQSNNFAIVEKSEFHDSINRGTSGGIHFQRTLDSGNSDRSGTLNFRNTLNTIGGSSEIESASFAGANMGYCSVSGQIAWRVPQSDFPGNKMEPEPPDHHMTNEHQHPSLQHERKDQNDEDSTTVRSIESASLGSPSHGPLVGHSEIEPNVGVGHGTVGGHSNATTPSTISTAPSTNDEGSMGALDANALERLALRGEMRGETMDSSAFYPPRLAGPAWENYQSQLYVPDESDHGTFSTAALPPPHPSPVLANPTSWANTTHVNQRVASFRNDIGLQRNDVHEQRWLQPPSHQAALRYENHGPTPLGTMRSNNGPTYAPMSYVPYQGGAQHRNLPASTPPRTGRPARIVQSPNTHRPSPISNATSQSNPLQTVSSTAGNPRSPSEVLKTLLRKKACLYEPDTSRAVALATWLVGRELALEYGYFSRQQLQAGVHACVAGKIDSGVITRTKVNRCMQIILNSCFHYIIPRPDGSEEKGDAFRLIFANEVTDDNELLHELPPPWNDLNVNRDVVLEASVAELEGKQSKESSSAPTTPQTSPRLGSVQADKTSPRSRDEIDLGDSKRAVLLCFNENVRCAEDVFRCHNEFIRDTAHASGLQLSSTEWRSFFGREASNAQQLWGNIGIPVPRTGNFAQSDVLGMMMHSELAKFRTTWCAKRYDHDHELCGFAHMEVNLGWLRRNFLQFDYSMEMCPDVIPYATGHVQDNRMYIINACPRGVNCSYAHSQEEIIYHPRRYKTKLCACLARHGGCSNGDVCPYFHPVDSYKFPVKRNEGRLNSRQSRQHGANASKASIPGGAPILYCSPAPVSRFEEQFQLPGLKNLYRRHCSVIKAHLRNPTSCFCCYSCFGDDDGTAIDAMKLSTSFKKPGLPQPRGV